MKHKLIKYLKEALLFIIVMTIFANILSIYRSSTLNKNPIDLKEIALIDNSIYKLPSNEPVLIHFWASWCPTCKAEAHNIERISKSFNVLTIAVKSGSDKELNDYLSNNKLSFKVLNDNSGKIAQKYLISVFPTTIIYNKKGEETFSEVGYTSTIGLWIRMLLAGF